MTFYLSMVGAVDDNSTIKMEVNEAQARIFNLLRHGICHMNYLFIFFYKKSVLCCAEEYKDGNN